jgi:hypothetical protein
LKSLLAKSKSNAKITKETSTKSAKPTKPVQPREPVQRLVVQKSNPKKSKLFEKFAEKLKGSKFRWINESLYTSTSDESFKLFKEDPELFHAYHKGFATQVEKWPMNPVDVILSELPSTGVIVDMGCGEAKIARVLSNTDLKVHSFDMIKANEYITACDIKKVPLEDKVADYCVFCLSLMGTNLSDFIREANRVMKIDGVLKIAEVVSRIDDEKLFKKQIEALGFECLGSRAEKMFVFMDFKKVQDSSPKSKPVKPTGWGTTVESKQSGELYLKPCLYKKR